MKSRKFYADVSQDCQIVPESLPTWLATLSDLRGQKIIVSLDTPKKVRTMRANRYWWGMVVPTFQELWSIGREQIGLPGYDRDETHDVLVQILVGFEDGPIPGTRVRKRTSEMDSARFAKMIDDARELAREKYGMHIPEPGESTEEEQ
jgi:hypothetical protein